MNDPSSPPYTPILPFTIAFKRNTKITGGYDTTFYSPAFTARRISREEVNRVLLGFYKIYKSDTRNNRYFAGLVVLYFIATFFVSGDFELESRIVYICFNVMILCYLMILVTCISNRSFYSNENTLKRYLGQCNYSYGLRGLQWSLFKQREAGMPRTSEEIYLNQMTKADDFAIANRVTPQSISFSRCTCCGGDVMYQGELTTPAQDKKAEDTKSIAVIMQTKIPFYSIGFCEAEYNSHFYLDELTHGRVRFDEVEQVLSRISDIRRPFCKNVKILAWLFITAVLGWLFVVILFFTIYINEDEPTTAIVIPLVVLFVIACILFGFALYTGKRANAAIRDYLDRINVDFVEKSLRWTLPGKFFNSVELCKEYAEQNVQHSDDASGGPVREYDAYSASGGGEIELQNPRDGATLLARE